MNVFVRAWQYALEPNNLALLRTALLRHLTLVGWAMLIGIVVCVPLGMITARSRLTSLIAVNLFNTLRVIPSLAILLVFLAIPGFGLGSRSALVALTILALPPILLNTDAAFRNLDAGIKEAARGMGMPASTQLWRVELPLALPVIFNGIRIALVEVIASATLAAFIGGGGLGNFITLGFNTSRTDILLVGAVPVALLALTADTVMAQLTKVFQYPR